MGIKDNRWQRNVDVRRYTLLAVDISSKLPNKNIYTNLCERWMPIIDELEFSSLSLGLYISIFYTQKFNILSFFKNQKHFYILLKKSFQTVAWILKSNHVLQK